MNTNVLKAVIDHLAAHPRVFLAGWVEGKHRYQGIGSPSVYPGSVFPVGSIGFAASEAALAFYRALDAD